MHHPALAAVIWLAFIVLLAVFVPGLSRQVRKIPNEPLPVKTLVITHDVEELNGDSGRYEPSRLVCRITSGLKTLESLACLRRISISNLIPDNFENRFTKLRIRFATVHTRLDLMPDGPQLPSAAGCRIDGTGVVAPA